MAKRFRIRELEEQYGDLRAVIPALVNERGQAGAATALGVSPATISTWLRDNGYTMQITYVRNDQPQEQRIS